MNPTNIRLRSNEQFAGAYAFDDRIVLITYGRIDDGTLLQAPVCFTAKLPATDDALGYGVLQALEVFQPRFVEPPDMDTRQKTLLKAMGVRNERELQRNARQCYFYRVPGSVGFQPTHNGGHKGEARGYRIIEGAGLALTDAASVAEIGATLRETFKRCTSVFE